MKKETIITLILLILIQQTIAQTENIQFTTQTTITRNLTLDTQNITLNYNITLQANWTNYTQNSTQEPTITTNGNWTDTTTWCYQEQANQTSYCTETGNGTYKIGDSTTDYNWADGNYDTYTTISNTLTTYTFYVNYTLPPNAIINYSRFQIQGEASGQRKYLNITLFDYNCDLTEGKLSFKIVAPTSDSFTKIYCLQSNTWLLYESQSWPSRTKLYEETMFWNIPLYTHIYNNNEEGNYTTEWTKPYGLIGANITFKYLNATQKINLNTTCINTNTEKIIITAHATTPNTTNHSIYLTCGNDILGNYSTPNALIHYINITWLLEGRYSKTHQLTLADNTTQKWNSSTQQIQTIDISNELNKITIINECNCTTCNLETTTCKIPIYFTTTQLNIQTNNLNWTNTTQSYNKNIYINITNQAGQTLTNIQTTQNDTAEQKNDNPVIISKINTPHGATINITVEDLDQYYKPNQFQFINWYNTTYYTFQMVPRNITLTFTETTDGIIQDRTNVKTFTGTQTTVNITSTTGRINIYFNPNEEDNYSQYYEIAPGTTTEASETLYILNKPTTEVWLRVFDRSHAPRTNAIVRVYQSNSTWTDTTYQLVGQRLTDDEGFVQFYLTPKMFTKITVHIEEYTQLTQLLNLIMQSNTQATYYTILMSANETTDNSYLLALDTQITDKTQDIYGTLVVQGNPTITYITSYKQAHGLGAYTALSQSVDIFNNYIPSNAYNLRLFHGVDYDSLTNDNITVYIYANGVLLTTQEIEYKTKTYTEIADIGALGLDESILKPLLFILLIMLTITTQFIFKDTQGQIGYYVFMIGSIALSLITTSFLLLSTISAIWLMLPFIKKIIGVTT